MMRGDSVEPTQVLGAKVLAVKENKHLAQR